MADAHHSAALTSAILGFPIGARVLAGNPRPDEFDDSFPEPVQSEWARVSFLILRDDLSVVEAEFIRPRAWIESLGLVKGARLDLAVPELEIDGLAEVTAVRACPPIAEGEGRVVTGRFATREAINVVTVRLANGTEIRATDVHPVRSVDREEWIPAGELEPGEQVDTLAGPVAVVSVERLESRVDVHNIEVHGEHVFRVTLFEARVLIERWRRHYNTVRPHNALGYRPPAPEDWQPCAAASATPQRPHRAGLSEDQPLT